jgi:predicted proteasome-type protease
MAAEFDRDQLLAAFDEIGLAAVSAHTRLDIVVYGGSALMLASNFRFSTEDVDIAEIGQPWPSWLSDVVARVATQERGRCLEGSIVLKQILRMENQLDAPRYPSSSL